MNCWTLVSISSTVSIPYLVMSFFGVPFKLAIMMIFAPASIQPDCLAFSTNFSLNSLADLDDRSKISGSLIIALLNTFVPVVEV